MKIKSILSTLCLSIFLSGCAKPLPADKSNFAGTWQSTDGRVNISITPEGRIEYSHEQPGKSTSLSLPIKDFQGDNFNAGVGPFTTEFKVTQPPVQDDQGNWSMVVDGYTIQKISP